jgi:ankyrin repeat protein
MTLDETYKRILLGIDEQKRERAIRLLSCLAFARRPLRVSELAEVCAVQFGTAIPRLNTRFRPGDANNAVLSACSTLVVIIKHGSFYNDGVVQFSHYSVKEFLISGRLAESANRDLSLYYISPEPAHTILAQTCISTLLQLDIHIGEITDSFPLAKYAAQYWFHHAHYGVASQIQDGLERLFDPDRKHLATWVSMHNIDHVPSRSRDSELPNPPEPSPLYYATLCGISSPMEYLITKRGQNPNESHGGWGTPLHAAAVLGHAAIALFLLDHNADVNARDKHNSTPLHEASGSGNLDVMKLLISRRADLNALDHEGRSPLHRAFQHQKFDSMKLLVNRDAVNVRDRSNSTLLHEASASGNFDVMELLLSHGADVDVHDHRGDSPLHRAFHHQNFDAVKILVNRGAVNVCDRSNSTLLHEAAGSGNIDIIRLLLDRDADVNVLDRCGDSPLHKAFRYHDAVKLLVDRGADVNARNKSNSTPLHEASGSGNRDVMELLLSLGADINAQDHRGVTPLHEASRYQNFDAMKLLVNGGAEVNVRDKNSSTPLHEASGSGNLDVVRLLLGLGADLNVHDHRGDSPLRRAFQHQKFDAMELLVNRCADVNVRNQFNSTLLHEASGSGNLYIAKLLLDHGAEVNALDQWGDTPLHKSFRSLTLDVEPPHKGRLKVTHDAYDWTLIGNASSSGNIDVVPPLSKKSTEAVNAQDNRCSTPLHDALQGGNYAMAELLLAYGADVNVRGWRNKTPLQLASFKGSLDVSRLLVEHGADLDAQNDEDQTSFLIALARRLRKVARFLLNE